MLSSHIQLVGLIAAAMTTTAFLPQLARTWRSGGHDLSYYMLTIFLVGVTLWLVYGVVIGSMPVVVANAATALQVAAIIVVKIVRRSAHLASEEAG